jgi:predicted alpha/beta superfamily hydrolase
MFKRHHIVFTALPLLIFCVLLVFLKTPSQSLLQAKLFAEGVINTDADEYGPTFTSDGKTLYFTRRVNRRDSEFIYVSRLENGRWSAPELAPFSGKYFDKEPFVAPDGNRIFFASLRPVGGVEPKNRRDFNIWFVEKTAGGWSEPNHVGPAVNSPAYENYPSVAANGTLYFAGEREGGKGGNDLYRARLVNGKYEQVERLDELNTPNVDADPYIAPDESYLIFCSDRSGGFGSGDLYISFNRNGKWTEPKNLGAAVNTAVFEYTPLISPDGKWLLFSRGWGEIYHIDRKAVDLAVNFGGQNERNEEDKKVVASAIIPGGERLKLPSKILGENRTVFLSLPVSYPGGVQSYPVLYLTDAQWNFEHTRATAAFLARNRIIPEMIIVGVTNPDRTRDLYATRADFKHNGRTIPFPNSGNADRFLEFIEKELIPWTEGAYRTAPLRILAGQSAGGAFALHAMRVKPALFQAVIAASPWLGWDDRKELKELVPFLASDKALARTLFFAYADEGPEVNYSI